jgi:catechol 2,3-dioxygenase-like lactoylglutathione lyase family enzyme
MNLGNFSISLSVEDIKASRVFYRILGLEVYDDHEAENRLILCSGTTYIGLY